MRNMEGMIIMEKTKTKSISLLNKTKLIVFKDNHKIKYNKEEKKDKESKISKINNEIINNLIFNIEYQ
jgi:hypothetical protein